MDLFDNTILNTVSLLVLLTVLVFVHEFGHFWVARKNGVKVEVFSVGFGKELFGWTDKLGTRWRFSAIPLGGYVKMFGEGDMVTGVDDTDERPMTEEEKKVSFHHKRLGQRAAIVAAGPIANFLFAVLVYWGMNAVYGTPSVLSGVGEVIKETAAEEAGFEAGDLIIAINGQDIKLFSELSEVVSGSANVQLRFDVLRDDQMIVLNATPRPWTGENAEGVSVSKGLLGIRPSPEHVKYNPTGIVEGLFMGVEQTYVMTARILSGLGEMFAGERSAKELGGIISIAQVSGQAAKAGMTSVLGVLAFISINLGLINLFPIPVLDGGHLVFYAAEAVRGKPLSQQLQEYSFRFGLVLVLLLMVFATWNDFGRLFG